VRLADGRTALSRHRKPVPAPARKRRPAGTFLLVMALVVAGLAGGGAVYLNIGRSGTGADPAGAVVAAIPSSRSVALLERDRQHLILMDAATKTLNEVGAPKLASAPVDQGASPVDGSSPSAPPVDVPVPDPGSAQAIADDMLASFGFDHSQFGCLVELWNRESGWRVNAENASGAYGIPQALPGSKMATAGADWATNPATQIRWGLGYIKGRYSTPCGAWGFWEAHGWY
jgi:hypothetical protein